MPDDKQKRRNQKNMNIHKRAISHFQTKKPMKQRTILIAQPI
jgi:hypothetical protein